MIVLYGDVGMYFFCTEWSPGYDGTGRTTVTRDIICQSLEKNKKAGFLRNTSTWALKFTCQIILSHMKFIVRLNAQSLKNQDYCIMYYPGLTNSAKPMNAENSLYSLAKRGVGLTV